MASALPSFLLRPAGPQDHRQILRLARELDSTNLPTDSAELAEVLERSAKSFAGEISKREHSIYVFCAEEIGRRRIVAASMIIGKHGTPSSPHYYFEMDADERYSHTLRRMFRHPFLRLRYSMEVNLSRVAQLRDVILVRTVNGLNAGVDSTIANAELSKARIAVTDAINYEQNQAANLAMQLGVNNQSFSLDSIYISQLPVRLPWQPVDGISNNPELKYMAARVKSADLSAKFISKTSLPKVSLFGVMQDRGSGFGSGYNPNIPSSYSQSYLDGINPVRGNYLVGVGITWNLTDLGRVASRVKSQHYQSDGLTNEYHYLENNLTNQLKEGNKQLANALQKYHEAPIQLKAAGDAYEQKKTLYSNGLTTIVDVTQTLYNLNRAETDRDLASTSVWQALLYMAGSSGNFNLFINQF